MSGINTLEELLFVTLFVLICLWPILRWIKRKQQQTQVDEDPELNKYLDDVEKCLERNKKWETYFRKRLFLPDDMTIEEYGIRAHTLPIQGWLHVFHNQFGVASDFSLKLANKTTMKIPVERYPKMKLRSGREI